MPSGGQVPSAAASHCHPDPSAACARGGGAGTHHAPHLRLWPLWVAGLPPNTPGGTGTFQGEGPVPVLTGVPEAPGRQPAGRSCFPSRVSRRAARVPSGRWLDVKHPSNNYSSLWVKEQSRDSVHHARPRCPWGSYIRLSCSRDGLFLSSDGLLGLIVIGLNEEPRRCSCGFVKLGGRGPPSAGCPPSAPASSLQGRHC